MNKIDINQIDDIYNLTVPVCLASTTVAGLFLNWQTNITNMYFQPDICVVRQIMYNTSNAVASSNIYVIGSDLNGGFIGTFAEMFTPANASQYAVIAQPQTTIRIKKPVENIKFQIYQISNDGLNRIIPVTGITSSQNAFLTLSLDFIKLKDSNKISNR